MDENHTDMENQAVEDNPDVDVRKSGFNLQVGGIVGFFVCMFVVCIVGIGLSGMAGFIDIPSVAIVVGLTYGVVFIAHGAPAAVLSHGWALQILFLKNSLGCLETYKLRMLWNVAGTGVCASIASGLIGTVIGLINMLSYGMDDPSVLTSGMAVALITELYGALFMLFFLAVRAKARQEFQLRNESPEVREEFSDRVGSVVPFYAVVGSLFLLLSFFVLVFTVMSDKEYPNQVHFENNTSANWVVVGKVYYKKPTDAFEDRERIALVSGIRFYPGEMSGYRIEYLLRNCHQISPLDEVKRIELRFINPDGGVFVVKKDFPEDKKQIDIVFGDYLPDDLKKLIIKKEAVEEK